MVMTVKAEDPKRPTEEFCEDVKVTE